MKFITMLHWLIQSDAGLYTRMIVGLGIFITLAIVDLKKRGKAATRWREYSVLATSVVIALLYGAINDQITCAISWEYFFYGKEIYKIIGPAVPPDMYALRWEAAKVGLKATWSVGLILGVAMLIANNPGQGRPGLKNRDLIKLIPAIFFTCIVFGAIGGFLGWFGWLTHLSRDFEDMAHADIFRPPHFMATWGVHLGGYIGGFVGTAAAIAIIVRRRKRLFRESSPANVPFGAAGSSEV